jgi:uncharacterized membrane protein HdeD (DUF308 family)
MGNSLSKSWWAVLVRGLLAIGFSLLAFGRPGLTIGLLIIFFGAYALNDGILALVEAGRAADRQERWWPIALEGVFGILVAIVTFLAPLATAKALFIVIACWAVITGVFELIAAVRLRKAIPGESLLVLSGLLRIAFGAFLFARPDAGLHTLVLLMGIYAAAYGVVLIGLSLRLKHHFGGEHPMVGGMTPHPV